MTAPRTTDAQAAAAGDWLWDVLPPDKSEERNVGLTDPETLRLFAERNPKAFHKLYIGGAKASDDDSSLDYWLASELAQVVGNNPERIKSLMRLSVISREGGKWTKNRGYLDRTVYTAIHQLKNGTGTDAPALINDGKPFIGRTLGEYRAHPELLRVPERISPYLIWRNQLTLLSAREKLGGKSTLAASDARGAVDVGRTVLWISADEDLNRIVKRLHDLGLPDEGVIIPERWPRSWEECEALIADKKPDAVYVDTLGSFLFAVEGRVPLPAEGEKWQAKVLRFKTWTTLGAGGVCVLGHSAKENGNARGSTGITAAPDMLVTMRDVETDPTHRRLEIIGRWGFPSPTVRWLDDVRGYEAVPLEEIRARAGNKEPKLTKARRAALKALDHAGMKYNDWRDASGVSPSTFATAVTWLRENKLATYDDATGLYQPEMFTASQTPNATNEEEG